MESLQTIALKSIDELTALAAEAPRFESIVYTQLINAKLTLIAGDKATSNMHVQAARKAYLRAQEVEQDQVKRVQRTASEVEAKGMSQSGLTSEVGKHVVRIGTNKAGAIWQQNWISR